jgi:hypothetical protein
MENDASYNSSLFCIIVAAGTCLPGGCLATVRVTLTDTQTDGRDLWSTPLRWAQVPWLDNVVWSGDRCVVNRKLRKRLGLWPVWQYYHWNCVEGLRKTTKIRSQDCCVLAEIRTFGKQQKHIYDTWQTVVLSLVLETSENDPCLLCCVCLLHVWSSLVFIGLSHSRGATVIVVLAPSTSETAWTIEERSCVMFNKPLRQRLSDCTLTL